jgi:hypothetical protein
MLIKQALGLGLSAHVGVVAIAGSRLYGGKLPQKLDGPAVVYKLDKTTDMPTLRNASITVESIFNIGCVASGSDAWMTAALLAHQVKLCLSGFHGTISDNASPESLIVIKGIFRMNEMDYFDDPTGTHWVVSQWQITHTVDPLVST